MKKSRIFLAIYLMLILCINLYAQTRGELEVFAPNGKVVGSFSQGYALVIGEINYTNGWDQLKSIKDDVVIVTKLLEEQSFIVETLVDKNSDELKRGIEDFLNKYGHERKGRLIVFFAGHGHTHTLYTGKKMGYIVPIDAPLPSINETGFLQKAIPMNQFETWSKQYSCRHILFIFDSCFSGTIFTTTRSRNATIPPAITNSIAEPVRQFITAGDENEEVPAESVFLPVMEEALRDRKADYNGDGYITGTELGMYLKYEIENRYKNKWHPQYGKSFDTNLDKGDFVFEVGKRDGSPPSVLETQYEIPNPNPTQETGKSAKQEEIVKPIKESKPLIYKLMDDTRMWTIGVSTGTSFAPPWLIGTVHTTLAPFRYSFFEVGIDFGMFSGEPEVEYYSLYPFTHYALFLPFYDISRGLYIGAGVGCMIVSYKFPEGDYSDQIFAADIIIGVNIGDFLDVSYTLRTNFNRVSNKLSVGYIYRFK